MPVPVKSGGITLATFLVAHGAWSAGWAWKKMRPLMRARGHEIITPTCTGVGERAHLASPEVSLDTHIADMLGVIEYEDLRDFILIGHSYGGMVATGVADRAAGRISQLVYLDAFVPRDGESMFSLQPPAARARLQEKANSAGEGWRVPANPMPPDTPQSDVDWALPRRCMQPLRTFDQPLRLSGAVETLRRTYIYCTRPAPGDVFRRFYERARTEPGWQHFSIDASHNPHITAPEVFAAMLEQIAVS